MSTASALHALRQALATPVDPDAEDQRDPALIAEVAPVLDAFCRRWYDLEIEGFEHVPSGPALIVGNHNAGITFVEALGVGARWAMEHPDDLWVGLGHDGVVDMPVLGRFLVRAGAVRAGHDNAARAFGRGDKVVVFPGGNLEAFRPWSQRNQVVFAQRKGWARLAIRHGVPVVPMVFHGGHNGFFVLRDGQRLARWIGADKVLRSDTWPLYVGLPWGVALGPVFHLPLPVKCRTRLLEPIPTAHLGADAADDPEVLQGLYDEVTGRMQATLEALAASS